MSTLKRIRTIVGEATCDNPADIAPSASLTEDLGLDGLDVVDLAMTIEEVFGIMIDDAEIEAVATVADLVELVERKTGQGNG